MSDIKDLNNEELENVSGGVETNNILFQVGDWFNKIESSFHETAFYVKDVSDREYTLIRYRLLNGRGGRGDTRKIDKVTLYNQRIEDYLDCTKISKPYWVKD